MVTTKKQEAQMKQKSRSSYRFMRQDDCNPISWETRVGNQRKFFVSQQIGAGNQYPQLLLTLFTFPEEEHFLYKTRI